MTSSKPKLKEMKLSVLLRVPQAGEEQLHEAFVNVQDSEEAIRAFENRWGTQFPDSYSMSREDLIVERNNLREVWLKAHRFETHKGTLPKDSERSYEQEVQELIPKYLGSQFSIRGKRIVLEPTNLSETIALLFHRDRLANRLAVCANSECPNPYFVRRRKTQIYCQAGPCVDQAKREQKREWWARNRGKDQQ